MHAFLFLWIMLLCANVAAMDTCNRHTYTQRTHITSQKTTKYISCHQFTYVKSFDFADATYCSYVWLPYTFLVSQVIYRVALVVHRAQSYGHYQMLIILIFYMDLTSSATKVPRVRLPLGRRGPGDGTCSNVDKPQEGGFFLQKPPASSETHPKHIIISLIRALFSLIILIGWSQMLI